MWDEKYDVIAYTDGASRGNPGPAAAGFILNNSSGTQLEGKATKFMLSQSFAHLIVIAFIIIGNVAFFKSGRKTTLKGK